MKVLMLSRYSSRPSGSKAKGPEVLSQGQILKGRLKMRMMFVGVKLISPSKDLGWRGILRNLKGFECQRSFKA